MNWIRKKIVCDWLRWHTSNYELDTFKDPFGSWRMRARCPYCKKELFW